MILNKTIINALQNRLKTGNRRGVHLNAVPGNSRYKLDLSLLNKIEENLSERFVLDLLTTSKLKFELQIGGQSLLEKDVSLDKKQDLIHNQIITKLENLIYQNESIISEKGINALGFGYPILVRKDMSDGKLTLAPLLIWSINIKATKSLNTFIISREEDAPIYVNEVLLHHLKQDSGVSLNTISEEMLDDGLIDKTELLNICEDILSKLNINQNLEELNNNFAAIEPIESKNKYEDLFSTRGQGKILKAGIFSLFEVQKQNIINDYDHFISEVTDSEDADFEDNLGELITDAPFQTFTTVQTDPSQQFVLECLKEKNKIIIQGPPGTGKSQTLTAILVNALENKKKTIVVCEKQTALEVLLQALIHLKLDDYAVLIKDVSTDRRLVVNKFRDVVDDPNFKTPLINKRFDEFDQQIQKLNDLKIKINSTHLKLLEELIPEINWMQIISQLSFYEKTKEKIEISDLAFTFTKEENQAFKALTEKAEQIYIAFKSYEEQPFISSKHTHLSFFEFKNKFIQAINDYQNLWQNLNLLIDDYKTTYFSIRENIFKEELNKINAIQREILLTSNLLDANHEVFQTQKVNGFFYKIMAWFSKSKQTNILKNKKLVNLYEELTKLSFSENLSPLQLTSNLYENIKLSQDYQVQVEEAKQNFSSLLEKDFKALDLLSFNDKMFNNSVLEKIKAEFILIKSRLIQDELLHISTDLSTSHQIRKFANYLIEKHLDYSQNPDQPLHLEFQWLQLTKDLSVNEKIIIERLKPINNWESSFFSAYFHILLNHNLSADLDINAIDYTRFDEEKEAFSSLQIEHIQQFWSKKRQEVVKTFEQNVRDLSVNNLYNKRSSNNFKRTTLRQIIDKDIDLFTSFFPIIFTTPDACSNMFEGKNNYFDFVIFDEASQLRIEETLPAMTKAKNIIIAGDEHQMPPSNYFSKVFDGDAEDEDELDEELLTQRDAILSLESLLEFAQEQQYEKNHLDFHYRSKHPLLIEFSNQAFYGGRLRPLPAQKDVNPIKFYQVNGEFEEHINQAEAQKVIDILMSIEPNEKGVYPSVGVATFNITQRNYIKRLIATKRSQPDQNSFNEKVNALESQGLFIKNLENIQGDERDIMILSTTYGKKKTGRFLQSFGPINHTKGYKLLNVIITRAKTFIHVVTSIPDEQINNYKEHLAQEGENNRKAIFYAYLYYCKAISENNEMNKNELLKTVKLYAKQGLDINDSEEENFTFAVYETLKSTIDVSIEVNHNFGGYNIDLLLKNDNNFLAIECLSKKRMTNDLAYLEDIHRANIIKSYNYSYIRVWAQDWWQDKEGVIKSIKSLLFVKT